MVMAENSDVDWPQIVSILALKNIFVIFFKRGILEDIPWSNAELLLAKRSQNTVIPKR